MFKSIARVLHGMFSVPFEEDAVVFKIKIKTGNQKYSSICWYKVYGYWKFKYDLTWTGLGVICEKKSEGRWYDEYRTEMLKLCRDVFVHQMREGITHNARTGVSKMEVSVQDLMPLLDEPGNLPEPKMNTERMLHTLSILNTERMRAMTDAVYRKRYRR